MGRDSLARAQRAPWLIAPSWRRYYDPGQRTTGPQGHETAANNPNPWNLNASAVIIRLSLTAARSCRRTFLKRLPA